MISKSLSALPIIDISPWLSDSDTSHRLSVAASIHAACLEYGFFYLNISAIADPSEPEELRRLAQEFFDLPQEEKDRISIAHQDHARGMWHPVHFAVSSRTDVCTQDTNA